MKTIRRMIWAVVLPLCLLAVGCETHYRGGRADFSNTSEVSVDVYRNGELQFPLAPNADGDTHVELDDDFTVLVHATGRVLGSFHVEGWRNVYEVSLQAIIYNDHVDWRTDLDDNRW